MCDMPKSFNVDVFWTFLTDLPPPFRPKKGKAMFIKDLQFWLLHKVLCCVVFHKSEFNRVSAQEMFLMWCIHNRKQACWTYWIFNQLLQSSSHKDVPLTYGHVITIIAKAFNIDFAQVTHVAPCTYFTKQALVRGEVIDASFRIVPAHTRSYWKGIPHPHFVGA